MKLKRQLSREQMAYVTAKALFEVSLEASRKHNAVMIAEAEKLGLRVPEAILPDEHPLMKQAEELFEEENAARKLMYEAAFLLFDWATEATLAKCGTEQQKIDIRQMVATVKTKTYVNKYFQDLVIASMKLAA